MKSFIHQMDLGREGIISFPLPNLEEKGWKFIPISNSFGNHPSFWREIPGEKSPLFISLILWMEDGGIEEIHSQDWEFHLYKKGWEMDDPEDYLKKWEDYLIHSSYHHSIQEILNWDLSLKIKSILDKEKSQILDLENLIRSSSYQRRINLLQSI